MARKRKYDDDEVHFTRLFDDFLEHPKIRSLSTRGFRALVHVLHSYRGRDPNRLTANYSTFPHSSHTLRKGLKELLLDNEILYVVEPGGLGGNGKSNTIYALNYPFSELARLGQKGPQYRKKTPQHT